MRNRSDDDLREEMVVVADFFSFIKRRREKNNNNKTCLLFAHHYTAKRRVMPRFFVHVLDLFRERRHPSRASTIRLRSTRGGECRDARLVESSILKDLAHAL